MSYVTCQCGERVERDEKSGKYICPKCGKEVKPRSIGWGN
jgi:predicted RNA-binding Zn-ribbon protein involved in translation (DUF1610 family)